MVLGPAVSTAPGSSLETQISALTLDGGNEKFWEWGSTICVSVSPPGGSDAQSALGTTD